MNDSARTGFQADGAQIVPSDSPIFHFKFILFSMRSVENNLSVYQNTWDENDLPSFDIIS